MATEPALFPWVVVLTLAGRPPARGERKHGARGFDQHHVVVRSLVVTPTLRTEEG